MTSSQALWALLAILAVQLCTDAAVLLAWLQASAFSRAQPFLVSTAAGVLLGTACLDLMPAAVQGSHDGTVLWATVLVAFLALSCLGALTRAGHSHNGDVQSLPGEGSRAQAADGRANNVWATLLLGSALHSTVDGLAIAAAFAAGPSAGWSAAIAVCLHELPHRLGDYSLLLHKGMSQRLAACLAILAGSTALGGGLVAISFGHYAQAAQWLLPVSAASFFYIALADLIPEIHSQQPSGRLWGEVACLCGGAALIAVLLHIPGE